MKRLSDEDANKHGIHTIHHEMENGEMRFRLVSENGSSYILTRSTLNNGWQKSHIHYKKREFYVVEKGFVLIALLVGNEVKIKKLCENDSFFIPVGVAHNVLMCDNAVMHTVKFGTQDEDWNSSTELDRVLSNFDIDYLLQPD